MFRRLWLSVGCAALLFGLGISTPALANDVSSQELKRLVEDAQHAPDALESLMGVTSVDGTRVDMASILGGDRQEQERRLESLSRVLPATGSTLDSDQLRAEAAEITSQPPFAGEVASGNGLLARIGEFLGRLLSGAAARGVGLLVLVAVMFAAALLIMDRVVARQRRRERQASKKHDDTPRDHRAEADAAAASGAYADAVRLYFVDGSVKLEEKQLVQSAATTSTATVRPLVDDARFLDRFDAIAYGGVAAGEDDVNEARHAWDRLVTRLGRR